MNNHFPNIVSRTLLIVFIIATSACATTSVPNVAGVRTIDVDVRQRGPVAGVGIESRDVVSMTDRMIRDMLANPQLNSYGPPPQVIVDAKYFVNESAQRLNKNIITDRLRVSLNRSARGRMVFVGRHYASMVSEERELKRAGVVGNATIGRSVAQAGADYRLGGRITSLDSRSVSTGFVQRYTQITFEMVDLERGVIVWSNIYEFGRAGADDIVYR